MHPTVLFPSHGRHLRLRRFLVGVGSVMNEYLPGPTGRSGAHSVPVPAGTRTHAHRHYYDALVALTT